MTLNYLWMTLVTYIAAIAFHEIGHFQYFRDHLNRDIKIIPYFDNWRSWGIKAGEAKDYEGMTDKQYRMMNFQGVASGYAVIIIAVFLFHWLTLLLIIPYTLGSWQDIKEMFSYGCS